MANVGRALPVAYLYNIEKVAYRPLSLPAVGTMCLFAGIEPNGDLADENDWFGVLDTCTRPDVPWSETAASGRYDVRRLTYTGLDFDDYPPVVRWHWHKSSPWSGKQAMGATCGTGWCVIGNGKPKIDEAAYGTSPQEIVPGWRDEQFLAEKRGAADFRVGKRRVVIVPNPALDPNGDFSSDYVLVARVYLDKRSDYYFGKYGFVHGNAPTEIWLRQTAPGPKPQFTAQIRAPNAQPRDIPVIHHAHPIGALTARWFWTFKDEHTWTPCPAGCCETNPPPYSLGP
jgi:hypothetical protein